MVAYHLKVYWLHDFPDEPTIIYSEVDDNGWEIRKIEQYRDGRADIAYSDIETGSTRLAEVQYSPIEEISAQDEFWPALITSADFAAAWGSARAQHPSGS